MASVRCLSCKLLTYFTPCSSVSIVNFEHVNADWKVIWMAGRFSGAKIYEPGCETAWNSWINLLFLTMPACMQKIVAQFSLDIFCRFDIGNYFWHAQVYVNTVIWIISLTTCKNSNSYLSSILWQLIFCFQSV